MLIVVLGIIIISVLVIVYYNRLIRLKNMVSESWSGIDVQLKRRYELIPQLIAVVKTYADFERKLFENVTVLRSSCMKESKIEIQSDQESKLSQEMRKVLILVESYPDLKANEQFLKLQHALVDVEENLQKARRYYNGTVRNLNIAIDQFPSNLVAKMGGFEQASFFELETITEKQPPQINN